MLDLIPPLALLLLSLGIAGTLGGKVRQLPLPGLALTCLIAPTLYAVGMLLYLLGDKWKPGMGVGSLGTMAVPAAIATTLLRGRARWIPPCLAVVTWCLAWILTIPELRPEAFGRYAVRTSIAVYLYLILLLAAFGLRGRTRAGDAAGLERRVLALSVPFLLVAGAYLSLFGLVPRKPVFSTSIHVCAEVLLLTLIGQSDAQDDVAEPNSLPSLLLQATLLALGALLLLVLAANLRVFPKAAGPVLVAATVATILSLAYGTLRPAIDALFLRALYPEVRAAEQRAAQLEAELERARDRLRSAEQLSVVGELAAQVAHEIKNPLGPIRGYTKIIEREALMNGALSEKVARGIEIIRQEVESIDARARALLELARPPQPELAPADLVELAEATLERARAAHPALAWTWGERPAEAPVELDGPLFRSALLNVLMNAAQAIERGGGGEVQLSLRQEGDEWWLDVADDGPGLPEEPEALFKAFVSHREGGSGLGLVIARGSLRSLRGDLELSNREPRGTQARFRLPRQGAPAVAAAPLASASETETQDEAQTPAEAKEETTT